MAVPTDRKTKLTRGAGAEALTEAGFPTAEGTLATRASRGGGPKYRRYGSRVIYEWGDLLDWAQSRLSAPIRSTSELDIAGGRESRAGKVVMTRGQEIAGP
jgi:hypothetical protein